MELSNNQSYELKKVMRQMIRMAKEVIEEIEKEKPDKNLISDIIYEEMDDSISQAEFCIGAKRVPNFISSFYTKGSKVVDQAPEGFADGQDC